MKPLSVEMARLMSIQNEIQAVCVVQGLPLGFDIMYLALADRNMQVRFGLKVIWES